mgnify:CR=1 FL=1
MKKMFFTLVVACFFSAEIFAQSLGTGSFRGVSYTKVPSGYRFPKHEGNVVNSLNAPSIIYSPNRRYFLVYFVSGAATEVGRLVLYKAGSNQILWRSGGIGGVGACVMQTDGNLVIYRLSDERWVPIRDGGPVWSSNTHNNDGAFLAIQNDGNVVVYNQNNTRALWATGTNGR